MTVPALIETLAEINNLPRYRAGFFLRTLILEIREDLARGGAVTLHGLGTLRIKRVRARWVRDFKGAGHAVGSRKISFHPSKSLRSLLS